MGDVAGQEHSSRAECTPSQPLFTLPGASWGLVIGSQEGLPPNPPLLAGGAPLPQLDGPGRPLLWGATAALSVLRTGERFFFGSSVWL